MNLIIFEIIKDAGSNTLPIRAPIIWPMFTLLAEDIIDILKLLDSLTEPGQLLSTGNYGRYSIKGTICPTWKHQMLQLTMSLKSLRSN